ncbi:hypothetical protein JL721_9029 [Aureococcus anophagefferens]|nr:hypothetical protein JL721_9029 [Aureococcus anophagefferens]
MRAALLLVALRACGGRRDADDFEIETPHHSFFVNELSQGWGCRGVVDAAVVVTRRHDGEDYVLRSCDYPVQAIQFLCSGMGGPAFDTALDDRDRRRAAATLAALERLAGDAARSATDALRMPPVDHTALHWPLAWLVDDLAESFGHRPLRALEVGSLEGGPRASGGRCCPRARARQEAAAGGDGEDWRLRRGFGPSIVVNRRRALATVAPTALPGGNLDSS